jgi:hypothetical protein
VKRIRLLILLGVLALAFPVGMLRAGAASTPSGAAEVEIEPNAQYDLEGSILFVEVKARCKGNGAVVVQVTQYPPETPYVVGFGSGPQPVVCDGRTHEAGVTIYGEGFDAGKALAEATLTSTTGEDTDKRYIDIRVV